LLGTFLGLSTLAGVIGGSNRQATRMAKGPTHIHSNKVHCATLSRLRDDGDVERHAASNLDAAVEPNVRESLRNRFGLRVVP
jgi:hypothetical protein